MGVAYKTKGLTLKDLERLKTGTECELAKKLGLSRMGLWGLRRRLER